MELLTANIGSYPRVGDRPEQQKLRWAYRDWEMGKISDGELEEVYREATREVIQEQIRAGLNVVTDGQLRWYDPISHFARRMEGCEIDGLLRFFDTNFYFRQPVVRGRVLWDEPIVLEEFLFAREESSVPVRPVVTGPYTLAKFSIDRHYGRLSSLVSDFAEAITMEVRELSRAGADEIQLDEPAILQNPDDMDVLLESTQKVAEAAKGSRLLFHVYFGDSTLLYDDMQELPVDGLGLDFTYSPELPDKIEREGSEKGLGLGLIDARNTKMESSEDIVPLLERLVPRVKGGRVYLNPSCGIEYLPREKAFEKLRNMVGIAGKFRMREGRS